jgi:hypothetical protein
MTEREYEEATVARERPRAAEPAAPVRPGTREWASAVGSAAVARLARERMVAREEAEEEELEEEPEAEAAEALPEGAPDLDELPEDSLPE